MRYPSHTELYKNLHMIEGAVIRDILEEILDPELLQMIRENIEDFDFYVDIEEAGWDIVVTIEDNIDQKQKCQLLIEYKSHINEWGKQVDQFFRQIKKRTKPLRDLELMSDSMKKHFEIEYGRHPILLSFDPAFLEFEQACERAGINLVVLDHEDPDFIEAYPSLEE